MKNAKRGPQNLALIALMLGVMNPIARADESIDFNSLVDAVISVDVVAEETASTNGLVGKVGVSVGELNTIIPNFKVQKNDRDIQFVGAIPKRCTKNASVDYKYKEGKHLLQFNIPACANGFKADEKEEMVAVSSVFKRQKLADQSGELYVLRRDAGDPNDTSLEVSDEKLSDRTGVTFYHKGSAEQQADADEAEKEAIAEQEAEAAAIAAQEKVEELERARKEIAEHCKKGNMPALTEAIYAIADLLGETSDALVAEAEEAYKAGLQDRITNAETAEEAKKAYEELLKLDTLDTAGKEEAKKAYIEKRIEILDGIIADPVDGYKSAAKAIKDWKIELKKLLKAKDYKAVEGTFAQRYSALATHAANNNDIKTAVMLYDEAKNYADNEGKRELDNAIGSIHMDQFKKCLEANPLTPKSCDGFVKQAKARSKMIEQSLARESGDDAEANLAAFQLQQVQTFGYGAGYTMDPLGQMNMYAGMVGQMKYESYAAAYYAQQQLWMQQMMSGAGMNGMNANGGSRGGLFGL